MNGLWDNFASVIFSVQFWYAVIFLTASLTVIVVGLIFIGLHLFMRRRGYRVQGRVIGAVLQHKPQRRAADKTDTEEPTLHVVYEYTDRNGLLKQEISSEGGGFVQNLQTGQTVRLVVCPSSPAYDDVYLDHWQPTIVGLCIASAGCLFTYFTLQHFGWRWEVVPGAGLLLLFGMARIYFKIRKHHGSSGGRPPSKRFAPQNIVPVETAVATRKQQAASRQ